MSEVKYTRGPLIVVPHPDEDCKIFALVDTTRPEEYRTFSDGLATVWSSSDDNAEANAHLFASASDLLAALETMIIHIHDGVTHKIYGGKPAAFDALTMAIARSKAAIARATHPTTQQKR